MYTLFWDMYSGGYQKLDFDYIIIKGNQKTATEIFIERFGFDPLRITCQCCGVDYSITEFGTKSEVREYIPYYVSNDDILIIESKELELVSVTKTLTQSSNKVYFKVDSSE